MAERLQKLIARAGLASRRAAEALILSGRVRVNRRVVTTLGTKADPARDLIQVDDVVLRFREKTVYLVVNKPRGMLTDAHADGRPTIYRLLRGLRERVFPVGRLPYEAEGLLLLTNDGEFADALLRAHVPQTFWFKIKGPLREEEVSRLARLAARRNERSFSLKQVKSGPNPWYEVVLRAPRQDWLRNWLFRSGHPVEKVKRVGVGSLRLRELPAGHFRALTEAERRRLLEEAAESLNRRSLRRASEAS